MLILTGPYRAGALRGLVRAFALKITDQFRTFPRELLPMPSHAFLEHTGVLAFAHRGDSEAAPENTAAAFESAVAQGFQYLETDVHCTSDGVLLAFHDDRLDRVTSDRGRIAALDYSVIARARVNGREPIPLLEELLAEFPLTRFNIDPKSDQAVEPLIEVIRNTRAQERVCIGSFSDKRLRHIRAALPGICTSMATFETTRARLASIGVPTGPLQAACAQVPVWWNGIKVVDGRFIRAMKARGLHTHVWTVNEREEMNRLLDLGVEGLMTDRPAVLKSVLRSRGQWHQLD